MRWLSGPFLACLALPPAASAPALLDSLHQLKQDLLGLLGSHHQPLPVWARPRPGLRPFHPDQPAHQSRPHLRPPPQAQSDHHADLELLLQYRPDPAQLHDEPLPWRPSPGLLPSTGAHLPALGNGLSQQQHDQDEDQVQQDLFREDVLGRPLHSKKVRP
jgi:hypothetical protein